MCLMFSLPRTSKHAMCTWPGNEDANSSNKFFLLPVIPTLSRRCKYIFAISLPMPDVAPTIMIFLFGEDVICKSYDSYCNDRQKKNPAKLIAFQVDPPAPKNPPRRIANRHW